MTLPAHYDDEASQLLPPLPLRDAQPLAFHGNAQQSTDALLVC
jgi:hypothetical protein